ncbi:transmembrane protein, putative [Bodo saltans]|uniref:Transmembrane protein, putative n=1 Tax=Bodo saltans TaxID=75058 RepID=A0A0S4J9P5_BODSA|nr:transmembrane protein, putative [Bodo saltans]|eukprot:CUG88223.1 transmembrane protein, putative [Bodo saltans]
MVPRLRIANRTTARNLTILFIDVMWSTVVNDTHRLYDSTNTGDTVLLSLRECTVEGLNVTMLRTNLSIVNNITMSPTSIANNMSEILMKVVLLEVYTDENIERGSAKGVSFTLINSTINFTQVNGCCDAVFNAQGSGLLNLYVNAGNISGVTVIITGTSFTAWIPYQKYFSPLLIYSGHMGTYSLSLVTNILLSIVRSTFTMHLSMCANGCGAEGTMFGGILYSQANVISGITIDLQRAQLVALPQSEEALNTTIGIAMNVGAVVFIPDISPVASMARLDIQVEDFVSAIASTMFASLLIFGNFSSFNDAGITVGSAMMLLTVYGPSINDAMTASRSGSVVLLNSALAVEVNISIHDVNVSCKMAAGFPTPAAAKIVSSVGVFVGSAVMMTGSARSIRFTLDHTSVVVNMTHGYLFHTFSNSQSFALDMSAALVALYPLPGQVAYFNSSAVTINSCQAFLSQVNFTAVADPLLFIYIISISTCAMTASVTIQQSTLTFHDIGLQSNAYHYAYTVPNSNLVFIHTNKMTVFDNTLFRAVDLMPSSVRQYYSSQVTEAAALNVNGTTARLFNSTVIIQRAQLNVSAPSNVGGSPMQIVAPMLLPSKVEGCHISIQQVTSTVPGALALLAWVGDTTVSNTTVFMKDMTVGSVLNGRGNLTMTSNSASISSSRIESSALLPSALVSTLDNYVGGLTLAVNSTVASHLPVPLSTVVEPSQLFWKHDRWRLSMSNVSSYSALPYLTNVSLLTSISESTLEVGCDVQWFNTLSPLVTPHSWTLYNLSVVGAPCSGTLTHSLPFTQSEVEASHTQCSQSVATMLPVVTSSRTFLLPLPREAVAVQLTRPVLGIASAAAVAVFLASGGAAVTAAADMQALLTLGMSNCAPSVLKKSSDVSLYLLSPFYALGLEAMAFGNIGLFVMLWLVQLLAVLMMERAQESTPVARRVTNAPNPADNVRPRLKYPNLSYAAGLLLVQGSLSGATTLVMNRSSAGEIVAGAAALVLLITGIALRVRAGRRAPLSLLVYSLYPMRVLRSVAWVPTWVLPSGEWVPERLRETHGRFRSSVRGGAEWMCEYATIVSMCVAVIGALPVPEEQCYIVVPVLLFIVYAVTFVLVVVVRPVRAPLANILQAASYLVMLGIAMCMFISGIKSNNSVNDDASSMSTAVLALSFALSVTSCLKAIHALFVTWWVRGLNLTAEVSKLAQFEWSPHQWRRLHSPDHKLEGHTFLTTVGDTQFHTMDIHKKRSAHTTKRSLPALAKLVTYICETQQRQSTNTGATNVFYF